MYVKLYNTVVSLILKNNYILTKFPKILEKLFFIKGANIRDE